MSEKKTIQINPDLFKFPEKATRKKQPSISTPKIEMKSNLKKQKQKSLRRNVLKMIREKQQDEYKRLFDNSSAKPLDKVAESQSSSSSKEFDKDFAESLEFFSSLANKPENQTDNHNKTFKKYPNDMIVPTPPVFMNTNENVHLQFPDISSHIEPSYNQGPVVIQPTVPSKSYLISSSLPLPPMPKYGCLKNGSLPTYRTFHNQINQQYPQINLPVVPLPAVPSSVVPSPAVPSPIIQKPFAFLGDSQPIKSSEIVQKYNKTHNVKNIENKIKYLKRKKIFKRTYCVGRSKIKPQIGVLVSNRTIRNRISTQSQLLKQTPIQDVRKFLIKKGFIKVGTNAPNDVLRKMYESVSLVCGEIENHNSENLLFNFIHDKVQ